MLRNQHVSNFLALVLSAVAASLAPLQVFIFVYAFVGPLHYLTEIAWLKKKDFYFGGGVGRNGCMLPSLRCFARRSALTTMSIAG